MVFWQKKVPSTNLSTPRAPLGRKELGKSVVVCRTQTPRTNRQAKHSGQGGGVQSSPIPGKAQPPIWHLGVEAQTSLQPLKAQTHPLMLQLTAHPYHGVSRQTHPEAQPEDICKWRNGRPMGIHPVETLPFQPLARPQCTLEVEGPRWEASKGNSRSREPRAQSMQISLSNSHGPFLKTSEASKSDP